MTLLRPANFSCCMLCASTSVLPGATALARLAASINSGVAPNTLLKRTRTRLPPSDTCTIWRKLDSRQRSTGNILSCSGTCCAAPQDAKQPDTTPAGEFERELRKLLEDWFGFEESGYGIEQVDDAVAAILAAHNRAIDQAYQRGVAEEAKCCEESGEHHVDCERRGRVAELEWVRDEAVPAAEDYCEHKMITGEGADQVKQAVEDRIASLTPDPNNTKESTDEEA